MPKKQVYTKDASGFGDFIYVDLLPEIKRAKQFNSNVIVTLLFAITLAFLLVYIPYSQLTFDLEDVSSQNNDLLHELQLTQEEFEGYDIDIAAIEFEASIVNIEKLDNDYNQLMDQIDLIVELNSGRIKDITYSSVNNQVQIKVATVSPYTYNTLNNQLINVPWISYSSYSDPIRYGNDVEYVADFVIGVDTSAE